MLVFAILSYIFATVFPRPGPSHRISQTTLSAHRTYPGRASYLLVSCLAHGRNGWSSGIIFSEEPPCRPPRAAVHIVQKKNRMGTYTQFGRIPMPSKSVTAFIDIHFPLPLPLRPLFVSTSLYAPPSVRASA
jgi:hypothetical protein